MKFIFLLVFHIFSFCVASAQGKIEELQGTILKREWTKTTESYCAGGSDYYILKTENEELVLESKAKTSAQKRFGNWVGKQVVVKGARVEKTIKNDNPFSQKPVSFSPDGKRIEDNFSCWVFRARAVRKR